MIPKKQIASNSNKKRENDHWLKFENWPLEIYIRIFQHYTDIDPTINTRPRLGSKCRTGTNCLGNFGRPEHLAAGPSSLIHRIYIIYKGWYQIIASSTWGTLHRNLPLCPEKAKQAS
jgi:hypothetical protein